MLNCPPHSLYSFIIPPKAYLSMNVPSGALSIVDPWYSWGHHFQMSPAQELPRRLMTCSHERIGKLPGWLRRSLSAQWVQLRAQAAVSVEALPQGLADLSLQCDHFSSLPSSSALTGQQWSLAPIIITEFRCIRQPDGSLCFNNDAVSYQSTEIISVADLF